MYSNHRIRFKDNVCMDVVLRAASLVNFWRQGIKRAILLKVAYVFLSFDKERL